MERQPEPSRGGLSGGAKLGCWLLCEPDDTPVVTEVGIPKLRVAVEPERADDASLEGAHEEVGEEVRARLLGQRLPNVVEGEHVVAGVAAETFHTGLGEHDVELPARAAVSERDGQSVIALPETRELATNGRRYLLRPVVQRRRQRVDVDPPAAPLRDRPHVQRQRSAHNNANPLRAAGSFTTLPSAK